jgi:prophage DNA circulation protein
MAASWRAGLKPGKFRNVPFYCRDTSNDAGQRLAIFEFPDGDTPEIQALGRGVKKYRLEIYVAGDNYMAQRDALEAALDADGAGTLVHPYKGPLQVYAEHPCQLKEMSASGRAAFFDVTFVEVGGAAPVPAPDTAAVAQSAAAAVLPVLVLAYAPDYDGASTSVQSAFATALASVQSAVGSELTCPGSRRGRLDRRR